MSDEFKNLEEMQKVSELDKDVGETMSSSQPLDQPVTASDPSSHRHECRNCGYIYDPLEGIKKFGISPGTPFLSIGQATFKCPVCRARAEAYKDIGPKSKSSGFEENLNYGLGVNRLTAGQKNVLIFGGLAFAVACFLSLYSLN